MDELTEILKRHFVDTGNYEVDDFIHAYGDPKQALLLFKVFSPDLIEVEGHVVLKTQIDSVGGPEKLVKDLSEGQRPKREILAGYRWLEIPHLFMDTVSLSDEEDHLLAKLIVETCKGTLSVKFPNKSFTVEVLKPSQTGSVVGVSFDDAPDV